MTFTDYFHKALHAFMANDPIKYIDAVNATPVRYREDVCAMVSLRSYEYEKGRLIYTPPACSEE